MKELGHQIISNVIIIGKNFVSIGNVLSVELLTISKECEVVNPFGIKYVIKRYGNTEMNRELKKLILEKNEHIDLTNEWDKYDLYNWREESPAVEELNSLGILLVNDWLKENTWFTRKGDQMTFNGWVNIRKDKSYHNVHAHNNTQLVLNYYVSVPNGSEIEFINPDSGSWVAKGANKLSNHTLKVEDGMMICVPAWWMHWVKPTFKDEYRISISSNVEF